ncbi:MAG: N-acetylglucosamine-6-phosphate deacetylase [Anaerolineales bacterium]|nr:N-acetylglucosamine-6-phosphate deacetylase [Anaerolineales bacterium]
MEKTLESIIIRNARVIKPDCSVVLGGVKIIGGKIDSIITNESKDIDVYRVIDAQGHYLAPGFIDIHVHGGNGADFMDCSKEAFETITQFYATRGVTSLQATITAAPIEEILRFLQVLRNWNHSGPHGGARILGAHLEGPFLNPEQCGAQPIDYLDSPNSESVERILEYADVITEVTLAPELSGAPGLIRRLVNTGILVSAGHSQSREKDVIAAIKAGLSHTTHLFSTMSTVIREGPWRIPGLLETSLVYDELSAEIISDGKHLPATLMRLAYKCKGPDKLCLVSDAMRGAGRPEGESFTLAGKSVIVADGVAMLADRSAFAASITPLDKALHIAIESLDLSVEQATSLVTKNPARIFGIETSKGTIEPGKDADLVVFDRNIRIWMTIIGGKIVYMSA